MKATERARPRRVTALVAAVGVACAAALLGWGSARADSSPTLRVPMIDAYVRECGSCHVAYAPGLLPAASWRRLMSGLDSHFGSDAAIDTTPQASITAWLEGHAASGRKRAQPPPQDRITRARWFVREHDEVRASDWTSTAVKSPVNCAACHRDAERGDFDEHRVRIPR